VVGGTVEETSNLLLALAHAAWLGQAFAHCPLNAETVGGDWAARGDSNSTGKPRTDTGQGRNGSARFFRLSRRQTR
jgi:hypothetical protein